LAKVNEHRYRNLPSNKFIPQRRNLWPIFTNSKVFHSIPSNIAEGYGRDGNSDYLRFLNISISSLFEMQTQLEISFNLKYITEYQFSKINGESKELERMLSSFIRRIKERK